jgi:pimeloyl-ACP methyl ester carboxylesterase
MSAQEARHHAVAGPFQGKFPGMGEPLWSRHGGRADGPLLLLLHGLGANANVFEGLVDVAEQRWPGGWLAPDLRGHGRSSWAPAYSFDEHAADVAELLDGTREVFALGHSMGGVVGLALAGTSYDVNLAAVVGIGIKVSWSAKDLDRVGQLAERDPATFESHREVADRFLKVAGLAGLAGVDDPVVTAGIKQVDDRWQLAMDPRGFAVGAPEMPALLRSAGCEVLLARGESDAMVSLADLRALQTDAVQLDGLGHNPQVENPLAVLELVEHMRTGDA